jgi:hypothetical protein
MHMTYGQVPSDEVLMAEDRLQRLDHMSVANRHLCDAKAQPMISPVTNHS